MILRIDGREAIGGMICGETEFLGAIRRTALLFEQQRKTNTSASSALQEKT
jgi:hypothetical protein